MRKYSRQTSSWLAAVFALVVAILGIIQISNYAARPLNWDDIDYVNAAKLGLVANGFEPQSLSLLDFYKVARLKAVGNVAAVQDVGRGLPPEATDPFLLRHFHPPLPVHFWSVWGHLGTSNTHWHLSMIVVFALSLIAIVTISRPVAPYNLCAAAIAFSAPSVISSYFNLSFHAWHVPALLLFTGMLLAELKRPTKALEIGLGVASALLILTLEMGAIALGTALIAILAAGKVRSIFQLNVLARVFGAGLVTLAVIWPGFFLKGGTLKAVAMYAYRLFAMRGEEYSTVSPLQYWADLAAANPVLLSWCALGIGLTLYGIVTKRLPRVYLAPFIMAVGYAVFMTPFALRPDYMLPALVLLAANTAIALQGYAVVGSQVARLQWVAVSAAGLALGWSVMTTPFSAERTLSNEQVAQMKSDVATIRAAIDPSRPILALGDHIFRHYNPGFDVHRATIVGSPSEFFRRLNYTDVPVSAALAKCQYAAVTVPNYDSVPPTVFDELQAQGYRVEQLNFFRVALAPMPAACQ